MATHKPLSGTLKRSQATTMRRLWLRARSSRPAVGSRFARWAARLPRSVGVSLQTDVLGKRSERRLDRDASELRGRDDLRVAHSVVGPTASMAGRLPQGTVGPHQLGAILLSGGVSELAEYQSLIDTPMPRGLCLALDSGIGHEREWVRFWRALADDAE
jgi:hypothetical protein